MSEIAEPDPSARTGWPAICWVGGLLGLLAILAGRLAWVWIPFDIFNHFLPHFVVLALACGLGLLVRRRRLLVTAVALIVGLAAIPASSRLSSLWLPLPPADTQPSTIRVMSFNSWLSNADWQAVLREIERNEPDIVTLIEFGHEKAALSAALRERYPYQTDCLEETYCHMAILSRFPFTGTGARALWRGPPQIIATFGPELGNLRVIGIHTLRPPHFRSQLKQVEALGAQVARFGGPRIVMGDFNATPFSRMLSTFAEASGLRRISWLPTWPASFGPFPQIAIDHIYVSDDLVPLGIARVGGNAGSDHYPVIADIRLPDTPSARTAVGALAPSR